MNAPETIRAAEPINPAHQVLLKADEALCVEEVARAILGGDKPTKACIKDATRQLKQLADLGMIEVEPRAGGVPFYRLISATQMVEIPLVEQKQEVAERDMVVIPPPPAYDPASVAFPSAGDGVPTKTYPPSVLRAMVSELSGDSEGGETDAPAADAHREEFTLLGLLADIRAAAGDPTGRLMQDELVQHIAGVVKERDDLRERLDAQIKQWQADTGRLAADLRAATEARSQAINEADRLRTELAAERQARQALQEQADAVDVKDAAVGYLVRVPKRAPLLRRKPESARSAALSAVRAGAARAEVLAIVPVGAARRGAEWGEA